MTRSDYHLQQYDLFPSSIAKVPLTLPAICLEIRDHLRGKLPALDDKFLSDTLAMLRGTIETWIEPCKDYGMDYSILNLVRSTIRFLEINGVK